MIVELTEDEIMDSLRFVHRVRENKKQYDVVDKKFDKGNTSYSVNLLGRLGEVAVSKVLRVPTDDAITPGGDGGYDLETPTKRIQVKTSTLPQLIFNSLELFTADVAVLVHFTGDKVLPHVDGVYDVMGWVDRQTFFDNYYNHDYGYGVRFVMNAENLYKMEDFTDDIPGLH
jgi:hypothetical protein